jgi:putative membrane protein
MNDPRVYFAAERTLLAWVRTGLAMMGFGFVVARFGLFLRELATERGGLPFGVIVNIVAATSHLRTVRMLNLDQPIAFRRLSLGIIVALVLGLLGLVVAFYLLFGLSAAR